MQTYSKNFLLKNPKIKTIFIDLRFVSKKLSCAYVRKTKERTFY